MTAELQKTIDEIGRTIHEFKALNDRRYEELKQSGHEGVEMRAAVDRANAQIVALETKLDAEQKKLRELETVTARLDLSPTDQKDQTRLHALAFHAHMAKVRGAPVPETVTPEQVQHYVAYKAAFLAYCRDPQRALGTDAIRAAITIGSDPGGGYTVTPDLTGKIVELLFESSPMRRYAAIQTTGKDRLVGFNDLDEDDSGSGWTGETSSRTETNTPEVGRWEIPVHEQYANPRASQSSLEDSDWDLEGWLIRKVAARLTRREALATVSGDGVAKIRGFTTYANANAPTKANWQRIEYVKTGVNGAFAAAPNGGDVFIDCLGLVKEGYLTPDCIWAMKRTVKAAARKLKDNDGTYILTQDFRDGFREMILGYPIVGFEDMAALATGSDSIAFGNFREGYQLVDRRGLTLLRDPYTAKPYVQFYTTRRVGGDVVNFEAIKLIRFAA
jgi:HK97 family phage major capsid protein